MPNKKKIIHNKNDIQQIQEKLGIPEDVKEITWDIKQEQRPYVAKSKAVTMENYAMVTGSIEEKTLKLTVVTVYDLSGAKETPDLLLSENEIDMWRQHLLSNIDIHSEMLRKALSVVLN